MAKMIKTATNKTAKTSKATSVGSPAAKKKVAAAPVKNARPKSAAKTAMKKKIAVRAPEKKSAKKMITEVKVKQTTKPKKALSPREERLQRIKLDLLKQKDALLDEAETALNELPGQTIYPDLGDQASAETDRSFMLRLRGREQRLLKKIEEAIDRIDNGTFGICDDCGNEIDIKRLEARPVTTMCIECKTLQEEEEKLREQ